MVGQERERYQAVSMAAAPQPGIPGKGGIQLSAIPKYVLKILLKFLLAWTLYEFKGNLF